jgi:hypothetical protein
MAAPYATCLPLLRDMRHVYTNPPSEDSTEGHRSLRAMKDKDFQKFLAQMQKLEADHHKKVEAGKLAVAAKKAAAAKAALEHGKAKVGQTTAFEDVGQENLEDLLQTVLKEAGA